MMKLKILLIILFLLTISAGVIIFARNKKMEKKVHYHAGFLVYIDGQKQDFSDMKYMNVKPCTDDPGKEVHADEQLEKAHLHDAVGDVVHVEAKDAVWGDLFKNIRYTFPKGKTVSGYVNGVVVNDILTYPIHPYDNALIIVGDNHGVNLGQTISKEHIQEIEKKSETCGS